MITWLSVCIVQAHRQCHGHLDVATSSPKSKSWFSPGARRPCPQRTQPPSPTPIMSHLVPPSQDRWQRCLHWCHEAGDACYCWPLKKAGVGGGWRGSVCVYVCGCVCMRACPVRGQKTTIVFCDSADTSFLSPFQSLVNGDHRNKLMSWYHLT